MDNAQIAVIHRKCRIILDALFLRMEITVGETKIRLGDNYKGLIIESPKMVWAREGEGCSGKEEWKQIDLSMAGLFKIAEQMKDDDATILAMETSVKKRESLIKNAKPAYLRI